MDNESVKNQEDESSTTPIEESVDQELNSKKDSFWRVGGLFPNIADMAIIYLFVMVSQLLGQFIAHLFGLSYDASMLNSVDEELKYSAQYAYGLYSLVSYGSAMLLSLLFVIGWKRYRGDKGRLLHFVRGANLANITLWGVIMTLCLGVALEPLLEITPQVPTYPGRGLPAVISLVIVAPLFEEIICRGVILEALRRRGGVLMALVVSSLFFALLHVNITLVINSFIMGMMLGFFYIRTKSIVVPIILHAINNAFAYILLYTNSSDITLSDIILNRDIYFTIYALSLLFLVVSAIKIARKIDVLSADEPKIN